MRVAVIYDFGVNKGGGDFVMINILEALSSTGYEFSLLTSYPKGLQEAAGFFDEPVPKVDVHYVRVPSYLRHPYTIAYVARKAVKAGGDAYDAYLVSDDIPKCIANKKGVIYIHYSHILRFKHPNFISNKYSKGVYKLAWYFHKHVYPIFFLTKNIPNNWLLLVNSTLTYKHLTETFNIKLKHHKKIKIVYPPVNSQELVKIYQERRVNKENLIVSVGRYEPERMYEELIEAVKKLKNSNTDIKLSIIGFEYDRNYVKKLIRLVKQKNLDKNVEIIVNAPRDTIINRLLKAKVYIHTAIREPFGVNVVEAMALGCIPVVRKGMNGPWTDITLEGKYGFGYTRFKDLLDNVIYILNNYYDLNLNSIMTRALYFDKVRFQRSFLEYINKFNI